jgi:Rrf2 family protein
MKIPAKVEYAYKAVLELALRYNGAIPVHIVDICESQKIPKKFLIHILLRLKTANIVNSSRGAAGGYYLTRPPSQISLADVFKAVDETVIGGSKDAKPGKVSDADQLLFKILAGINRDIESRLEDITLGKLIAQIKNEQFTYHI